MKTDNNDFEDKTKHGEFVSSYFKWNTIEEQNEIVKKLEDITSVKNYNKKKKEDK